ncbi:MAG: DNA-binding transcriptional regulator [Pirellula sp.]
MPKSTKQRKAVALLVETSNAYARGLLEGIAEYQRERDNWSIFLPEQERGAAPPTWLRSWKGDGVIARIETPVIAHSVSRLRVPIVDLSSSRGIKNVPWVETDDAAIAKLAFEHLYERGFRQFAFCGPQGFNWSKWRCEHFESECRRAEVEVQSFQTESPFRSHRTNSAHDQLVAWLKSLPKPVGMLCAYDIQAQIVLDICRNLGIPVPERIAVVGVDNDAILCDLCHPSLTSIEPDARGAGYAAAKLLDQLMNSRGRVLRTTNTRARQATSLLLKPIGIVQRQSTEVTAVSDSNVAEAIRFIRNHACDGIQVSDVLFHVARSRRSLESQFLKATGKTPHEMILSVRLSRVHQLLTQSDLTLEEVADRCGFEHPEYMSVVFKRHFGSSPGRFRRNR